MSTALPDGSKVTDLYIGQDKFRSQLAAAQRFMADRAHAHTVAIRRPAPCPCRVPTPWPVSSGHAARATNH